MNATEQWFQKSVNTLALNGKAERTQEAYTRALRMLCQFYAKAPDAITEPELEAYFLHRKNTDRWSANTMRICYCGIRFYFVQVLQRNWQLFNILRASPNRACPPCSPGKKSARCSPACTPPTTAPFSPLFTPAACGCRRRSSWRSPTSMPTA